MLSSHSSQRAERRALPPPPPAVPIAFDEEAAIWSMVLERQCLKAFKHPRLVVDNYIFHFHKRCKMHVRWKCNRVSSFNCPSVVKTTLDMTDFRVVYVDHDHTHPHDRRAIVQAQNRLALLRPISSEDPSVDNANTLLILKDTGIFDQQNGKRLHPYNSKKFIKDTMFTPSKKMKLDVTNENDYGSASSKNQRASRLEQSLLDFQNNSLNQSGHNEIEIIKHVSSNSSRINRDEIVHHQNTTVHVNIKSSCGQLHRKTTTESNNVNISCNTNQSTPGIECPSTSVVDLRNESSKSNDIIYILDSDDDNDNECGKNDEVNGGHIFDLDAMNLSKENLDSMLKIVKNPSIGIKNSGRLETSDSRQKKQLVDFSYSAKNQTETYSRNIISGLSTSNVNKEKIPASFAVKPSQKSVILFNTTNVVQKQKTHHNNGSISEEMSDVQNTAHIATNNQTQANFEIAPLPDNSPPKSELEIARIHSSKGVVSITLEKKNGTLAPNLRNQNPSSSSISEKVPIKKKYGLNSSVSLIPISDENGVPDLSPKKLSDEAEGDKITQKIIDMLLENRLSNGFMIKNSYSLNEKVPPAIPLLSAVHLKLQKLYPLDKRSNLPPTPTVVLHLHSFKDKSVEHDTLNLDLECYYKQQKKPLKKIIKSCEVFYLKVGTMDAIDDCEWKLVGVRKPVFWPYCVILNVKSGAKNHRFYFSIRVLDFEGKYSDFSKPQCTLSEYNV